MRKIFTMVLFTIVSIFSTKAQNFTPGNLIVSRFGGDASNGAGASALTSAASAVFLDEYTPSGTYVQTLAIPNTTAGARLVNAGSSTSEGMLSRSTSGNALLLAGYDQAVATTSVASSVGNRCIAVVTAAKTVDLSTQFSYATGSIRTAVSSDGNNLWFAGSTLGQFYIPRGGTTSTLIADSLTNSRVLVISENNLFISTASGTRGRIAKISTGLPTTSLGKSYESLPGVITTGGSYYQFVFFDLNQSVPGNDVLYVADDASNTGLVKYSLVAGTWTLNGNVPLTGNGLRGLTATATGNTIVFYGVNGANIVTLTDNSGYNATNTGTFTNIATAPSNTAFRGIAFSPVGTLPVSLATFTASSINNQAVLNWKTSNEVNSSKYVIEKSTTGSKFTAIGEVASKNSTNGATYTFTDNATIANAQYYRLKMIDKDGSFTYSTVVSLVGKETSSLKIYPNPVQNIAVVAHAKAIDATQIIISSINGKQMKQIAVASGSIQTSFSVENLPLGNYILQVKNSTGTIKQSTQFQKS
jgi:Secretion system C-terminal sorting domain